MTRSPLFLYILLACALLATAAAYWIGLDGPFVLDDESNFAAIGRWLTHGLSWRQTLSSVDSGPGGRPLSIASFMLSAWLGGMAPWGFKAGNLALHLGNGLLVFVLLRQLARRDPVYAPLAPVAALALTTLWLLHPLLVSTVLYTVQRMAMLSATFILLGLIAYCHGRTMLDSGRHRAGAAWLFLAVPACTLLGATAKENALLLPLFCTILELCYFRPALTDKRPMAARLFLLLGVVLPTITVLTLVGLHPGLVLDGYQGRSFTPPQRLLTEARVLWDYVASIVLPWGPRLSLYRDDYPVSVSLLSPPSTLVAVLAWCLAIAVAWRTRHNMPAVAAGLGLFLVGHAMESTVFPLLLYFEHRNYFPALGILWAAGALLLAVAKKLAPRMAHPRPVFTSGLLLLVLGFALATHARSLVWSNKDTLLASSLRASPGSRWVRMDLALNALQREPIDVAGARVHYAALQAQPDPISRQIGAQGRVVVDCGVDGRVNGSRVQTLFAQSGRQIEADQYQMLDMLGGLLLRRPCDGLSPAQLANGMAAWLQQSPTPESARVKKNLRFLDAQLLITAAKPQMALEQALISWHAGARELPLAAMIIDLRIALGQQQEALQLLNSVTPSIPPGDVRGHEVFSVLRRRLAQSPVNE